MPLALAPIDRLIRSTEVDWRGCWLWTRPLDSNGYGYTRIDGKQWKTHRLWWTLLVGEVPEGFDLDHLCRVRSCGNPDHLEPVTHAENLRRGKHRNNLLHVQKVCSKGHELTPDNITIRNDGRARCRTCVNETARRARAGRAA